jgi:hypothetical protein
MYVAILLFSWQFGMVLSNLLIKFYFLLCRYWNVILALLKKCGFYLKLFHTTLGACKLIISFLPTLIGPRYNNSLETNGEEMY